MSEMEIVDRDAKGIRCECGGYAEVTDVTPEEIAGPLNCGRGFACCVAAFICGLCGKRTVVSRAAPEPGW